MIRLVLPYPTHCVPFDGAISHGYGVLRHEGRIVRAHRLSFCQANGMRLADIAGLQVRHRCDNPECINPAHLELGTHTDNMRDMAERGRNRQPKGEGNGRSKLTTAQVAEIRAMQSAGGSARGIALRMGLNPSTVWRACKGRTWSAAA